MGKGFSTGTAVPAGCPCLTQINNPERGQSKWKKWWSWILSALLYPQHRWKTHRLWPSPSWTPKHSISSLLIWFVSKKPAVKAASLQSADLPSVCIRHICWLSWRKSAFIASHLENTKRRQLRQWAGCCSSIFIFYRDAYYDPGTSSCIKLLKGWCCTDVSVEYEKTCRAFIAAWSHEEEKNISGTQKIACKA